MVQYGASSPTVSLSFQNQPTLNVERLIILNLHALKTRVWGTFIYIVFTIRSSKTFQTDAAVETDTINACPLIVARNRCTVIDINFTSSTWKREYESMLAALQIGPPTYSVIAALTKAAVELFFQGLRNDSY